MATDLENFQAYFHIKAFDVISAGQFKKHISKCRECGDQWAVQMYTRHCTISNRLRDMTSLISQLNTPSSHLLQKICKDVISCAQPPIKVLTGQNTCCLTGVSVEYCVDLTKPGKNAKEVHVHPRFWHFFLFLWFCSKLEYVIRACTKQWVDNMDDSLKTKEYMDICKEFTVQNEHLTARMHGLFEMAQAYVTASLLTHRDKARVQPVLHPPAEFFQPDATPVN
jgi:hypothetical protein